VGDQPFCKANEEELSHTMHTVQVPLEKHSAERFDRGTDEIAIKLTPEQKERRRALIVPREHGAWGMLLIPLATGTAVGLREGGHWTPVLLLTAAVLGLFWLRTPLESWFGTSALRVQTERERRLVFSVILPLAAACSASLFALSWQGRNRDLIWLGGIAGVVFAAQIFLRKVGKAGRMAGEVVGAIALTATAPAAYYVATGRLEARAWSLWLVNWLFAADQIHFVWTRIRGARAYGFSERLALGWSFFSGNILLGAGLALACRQGWLSAFTLIAFVPILIRGLMWFVKNPQPIRLRRLGWTEMAHAILFGALLTAAYAFTR